MKNPFCRGFKGLMRVLKTTKAKCPNIFKVWGAKTNKQVNKQVLLLVSCSTKQFLLHAAVCKAAVKDVPEEKVRRGKC